MWSEPSLVVEGLSPGNPIEWDRFPGRLIVLSGASGSGKSTLVDRLLERHGRNLARSISATTRDPRPGEVEGVNYRFVTRAEFEADRALGEYLESAEVHGNFYGTPLGPIRQSLRLGTCIILVIDVQGAMQVREKVPNALLIFVHAPDREALEARLRARGTDDEATIQKRLSNARGEVALADRYDYQIVNDDLDKAVDQLAAILLENHCGG
jgi:guanylate kinase